MLKPLAFKGDKRPKKRKGLHKGEDDNNETAAADHGAAENIDDDSWVTAEAATDVTGPIIVALPSTEPTCIACDVNGKVFTSELENLIEGDLATAEPHDVQQVWVANRVAGTEEITLKGHHGW